jgi:tryptophanyl-tRNA synthetase
LHAITAYHEPAELQAKVRELAALFLAAGIDPKQSAIFAQSDVHAHTELAWMLTCVTPMGWLERMTQFKAKSAKQESVGDGIFQYPVLMAADILLYQAAIVPVGDDQSQHLELTRDIATRFNSLYGDTFVVPKTDLPSVGARIMGLDDPTAKMSKSAIGSGHAIALLDDPAKIQKTMMRATTDSNPEVNFETMGPGVANLLTIYQAFGEKTNEARGRNGDRKAGTVTSRVPSHSSRTRLSGWNPARRQRARRASSQSNRSDSQIPNGPVQKSRHDLNQKTSDSGAANLGCSRLLGGPLELSENPRLFSPLQN